MPPSPPGPPSGVVLADGVAEEPQSSAGQVNATPLRILAITSGTSRVPSAVPRRAGSSEGPCAWLFCMKTSFSVTDGVLDQQSTAERRIPADRTGVLGIAALDGQALKNDVQGVGCWSR